jgi:maltooligosyltrehalose trehalohydrolase
MHKDLIRLRREEPALAPRDQRWFEGTVLGERAFLLRYFGQSESDDRLLLVNLGTDKVICPMPEPLLAPPPGCEWAIRWSSEDVAYGGLGTPALLMHNHWKLLGKSALWLAPEKQPEEQPEERDHG